MHGWPAALENDVGLGRERLMINRIHIRHFRCFEDIEQSELTQFNFIVGESGIGKTALLEALFLAGGGNPELYFRIRRIRGFGESGIELSGTKESYESLFRDLFYQFDQTQHVRISFAGTQTRERTVSVYYGSEKSYTLPMKGTTPTGNAFLVDPIIFEWKSAGGRQTTEIKVEIKDGALRMVGQAPVYPMYMHTAATYSAKQNGTRYSELSRQNKEKSVLDAVQNIFPNVRGISLENVSGESMIYASMPHLREKIPVGLLSSGINKFLGIILSIISNEGGVLLIDEIESGFFYKDQTKLLTELVRLCKAYSVQLFVTTHSYELLQSLVPVMEGADDFTLLRMERGGNQPIIRLSHGENYKAALEQSFEVR
jgi:predicted ATPase